MRRILVIRGGAIGDFVLTLPVFEAIWQADPDVEIEILGYRKIAELAVGRRHALASRAVDGAEWAPLFSGSGTLRDREREYVSGFDRVFCVWPDAEGVIQGNLDRAGARDVVWVDPMPPEKKSVHALDHVAAQCERAGLSIKHREPHLYPSVRDRWWVERYMRVTGAGIRTPLGMHPGSGSQSKNWPVEGFVEVGRRWIQRRKGHVLVFAGPADEEAAGVLLSELDAEKAFVMRNESLPRVAAGIERCAAFVGNDSGISHMAAAVRTPTVAVFGPTDPAMWRPMAPRVRVVTPARSGAGLSTISADEVMAAVEDVLRAR